MKNKILLLLTICFTIPAFAMMTKSQVKNQHKSLEEKIESYEKQIEKLEEQMRCMPKKGYNKSKPEEEDMGAYQQIYRRGTTKSTEEIDQEIKKLEFKKSAYEERLKNLEKKYPQFLD